MSTHDGYDGYDGYEDDYADDEPRVQEPVRRGRAPGGATPLGAGLAGLLIGALLAGIALTAVGGNPFSDANDVTYRDVVIADISEEGDSVCWSTEPGRRDAPQECAILAIDPAAAAPEEGERVTVGLVRLRPPDGEGVLQVVYVRGAGPASGPADDSSPGTGEAGETDGDAEGDTDPGTDADETALSGDEPAAEG